MQGTHVVCVFRINSVTPVHVVTTCTTVALREAHEKTQRLRKKITASWNYLRKKRVLQLFIVLSWTVIFLASRLWSKALTREALALYLHGGLVQGSPQTQGHSPSSPSTQTQNQITVQGPLLWVTTFSHILQSLKSKWSGIHPFVGQGYETNTVFPHTSRFCQCRINICVQVNLHCMY